MPPACSTFKPGCHAEVTSDEDGYIRVWYESNIIRATRDGSCTVLYDDHLHNVKATNIRPLPPPFVLNQAVDALDKDGWWVGIISGFNEEANQYTVLFAEEECEYRPEDLRPHMDWFGQWIQPDQGLPESASKSKAPESQVLPSRTKRRFVPVFPARHPFKAGERVEVTSDQEGYVGAWYAARVVCPAGNGCYTVVYDNLMDEVDSSVHLIEDIDAIHIRPRPPPFVVHQFVDVFYKEGWWSGVISAVHDKGKRYTVRFAEVEWECSAETMRPHMDWLSGKWIIPKKVQPEMIKTILPYLPVGLHYNHSD